MPEPQSSPRTAMIVEEEMRFTLADLCRVCQASDAQLIVLVEEGVLEPVGSTPENWYFTGAALTRARTALRLERDLGLESAGIALVLELLDEIAELRARLRRAGLR